MGSSVEAMRTRYAVARKASGLKAAEFEYRARQLAHELADGEEVLPCHWVQAAEEVAYYAKKGGK